MHALLIFFRSFFFLFDAWTLKFVWKGERTAETVKVYSNLFLQVTKLSLVNAKLTKSLSMHNLATSFSSSETLSSTAGETPTRELSPTTSAQGSSLHLNLSESWQKLHHPWTRKDKREACDTPPIFLLLSPASGNEIVQNPESPVLKFVGRPVSDMMSGRALLSLLFCVPPSHPPLTQATIYQIILGLAFE